MTKLWLLIDQEHTTQFQDHDSQKLRKVIIGYGKQGCPRKILLNALSLESL